MMRAEIVLSCSFLEVVEAAAVAGEAVDLAAADTES